MPPSPQASPPTKRPRGRPRTRATRGLKTFAVAVAAAVRDAPAGMTTYPALADRLVESTLAAGGAPTPDKEKNVRRRVYDTLNVLAALGLVARAGDRALSWCGVPGFLAATHSTGGPLPRNPHPAAEEAGERRKVEAARARVAELRRRHDALAAAMAAVRALVGRNAAGARGLVRVGEDEATLVREGVPWGGEEVLSLPFVLVAVQAGARVEVEVGEGRGVVGLVVRGGEFVVLRGFEVARLVGGEARADGIGVVGGVLSEDEPVEPDALVRTPPVVFASADPAPEPSYWLNS